MTGEERYRSLPKAELHVHLQGAMPVELFAELLSDRLPEALNQMAPEYLQEFERSPNIAPFLEAGKRSTEQVRPLFEYRSFEQFITTWIFVRYFFGRVDAFTALVQGVAQKLRDDGIVYAEVIVSPWDFMRAGLSLDAIFSTLSEARRVEGIRIQWIVDGARDTGPENVKHQVEHAVLRGYPDIVGITLGGSEHLYPPRPFKEVYEWAQDQGLRLSVHAGEAAGPESIWDAIEYLRPERIGHGVRAIEDPHLLAYLTEEPIPLEVCPTSNICTGIYPSLEAHPIRRLLEAAVPMSISTDDPTFFDVTLSDEYANLERIGISEEQVLELMVNGFRHVFITPSEADGYISALHGAWNRRPEHVGGAAS